MVIEIAARLIQFRRAPLAPPHHWIPPPRPAPLLPPTLAPRQRRGAWGGAGRARVLVWVTRGRRGFPYLFLSRTLQRSRRRPRRGPPTFAPYPARRGAPLYGDPPTSTLPPHTVGSLCPRSPLISQRPPHIVGIWGVVGDLFYLLFSVLSFLFFFSIVSLYFIPFFTIPTIIIYS